MIDALRQVPPLDAVEAFAIIMCFSLFRHLVRRYL